MTVVNTEKNSNVCGTILRVEDGIPDDEDVLTLLDASEHYSKTLYPPESVHTLSVKSLYAPNVIFKVARLETGPAIGCGAIVLDDQQHGEIKRMFVAIHARRRGVGERLLTDLEMVARTRGVRMLRLETGIYQPDAIRLYHRAGFSQREPFAPYWNDPLSIFMEKPLV